MSRAATTRDRLRGTPPEAARRPARTPRPSRPADPRRRLVIRIGLAVTAVAVAVWVVWGSPLLAVSTVRVDGAGSLTADQVRAAAGVAEGTPLLRVDVDAAAARVARLPQVASVQVTRGWPQTVVITVEERVPVAVVEQAGTRSLVDAGGVLFDTVTGEAPDGVVPLEVATPGPEDAATRAGLAALVELPRDVRARVGAVAARSGNDVTLVLTDGTTVLWGTAADSAEKADVLVALLDQVAAGALDPAATIDVSTPDAVVLR
ncbi:cell division protein FtsQ/DivIB [Trujillonella endophytica]|uniref:Cell division protein FtsQ n=1 Tax=Trujillonella endophytica TaxID=673521 RepID=A0A1H8U389_9ACTN|nr:FtsQ-type POTRA domain-containing protein [Trujillella endophytica]SEO97303.1 cell division protein FtsQ [Trujillella endophytica]